MTGGYGGIGEAVSHGLAEVGRKVAVAGHNADKAAACAEALRKRGHDAYTAAFESLGIGDRRMVDDVARQFGRLDILVNCVGLNREEKAEEVTEEMFDHVVDVNLKSAMFQAQAAARHMIEQGARRQAGAHRIGPHAARRFAGAATPPTARARAGSRFCASSSRPSGRHIGSTSMSSRQRSSAPQQVAHMLADAQFYNALRRAIPLGRIAEPEDVWNAVLFFVSAASAFVTGQTLYLDGGITATQ